MINKFIGLFYSEFVKTKLNNSNSGEYILREDVKVLNEFASKIDYVFLKAIKLFAFLLAFLFLFNFNKTLFAVDVMISAIYYLYKFILKKNTAKYIENIKESDKLDKIRELKKNSFGIGALLSLILIGLFTGFNAYIVLSFLIILFFQLKSYIL
ncbi:MAG: hypothetical protein LBR30_04455 [Clostridioides sp.]|jgi:hypothetical protein|nr:hypothetical protein [Clostridioides sp.]